MGTMDLRTQVTWSTLTSSGRVAPVNVEAHNNTEWALFVESENSTVTVDFDAGISGGSTSKFVTLASTTTGSTGFVARMGVTGPLQWVAPRLVGVSNTNGVTLRLIGVG